MNEKYYSIARFHSDASARALIEVINPRDRSLATDTHHRLVWSLFAGDGGRNQERDFLWRFDNGTFSILSARPPSDRHSLFEIKTTRFETSFKAGSRLRFRLRANPTICRTTNHGNKRTQKRHDVVYDALLAAQKKYPDRQKAELRADVIPEAAGNWLDNAGKNNGFLVLDLAPPQYSTVKVPRSKGRPASFGFLDLEGRLEISDPVKFEAVAIRGLGRAKAFGCGLFSLMAN